MPWSKTGLTVLIGITRQKFVLERRQDRRQYVAINVIKKVDSEQKRQGTGGGGFSLARHNAIAE